MPMCTSQCLAIKLKKSTNTKKQSKTILLNKPLLSTL